MRSKVKDSLANVAGNVYRRRWFVWIVACLAQTLGLFHRASMSPMADRIMGDFGVSATALGGLAAAYFYIYSAMQLPSGTLADTLGPRKTITMGLLLSAAGALVMSQAPSFSLVYAGRIIMSFGASVVWLSIIKLLMAWFRTGELGTMTGLSSAVGNSGQIIAATPLAVLITSIGWRMSILSVSLVTFGLAIAGWLIIRDSPAQAGLAGVAGYDAGGVLEAGRPAHQPGLGKRLRAVVTNRGLWPLFFIHFGMYGAYSTFFHNWAVVYLMQTYGVTRDAAANLPLVAAVGQIIGAPLLGFLVDRVWHRLRLPTVISAGVALAGFLVLSTWHGGSLPFEALYPACFFIGLSMGAVPLVFVSANALSPPGVRGTATGLVNTGGFIGAAMAQPLFGYLLDRNWEGVIIGGVRFYPAAGFQQGLWLCAGLAAVGLIGALLSRETFRRALPDHG